MNGLKEDKKKEHPSIGGGTGRKEKIQQDKYRCNVDGCRDRLCTVLCYFFACRIRKGEIHIKNKKNYKTLTFKKKSKKSGFLI